MQGGNPEMILDCVKLFPEPEKLPHTNETNQLQLFEAFSHASCPADAECVYNNFLLSFCVFVECISTLSGY